MELITVRLYGNVCEPNPREIPESNIGELGGLEKCFGFTDYKAGIKSGKISQYDEIRIPQGFVNPDESIFYHWNIYFAVDEKCLKRDFGTINWNPRKELKAIHWYLKK